MKRFTYVALALALGTMVLGGCKKNEEKKPAEATANAVSKGLNAAGKAVDDAGRATGKAVSDAVKK